MSVVIGRTYLLASSHLTYEEVTPWGDDSFTVESELIPKMTRVTLEEIEGVHPVAGPVIAGLIRRELLSDAHAGCGYRRKLHPSRGGFWQDGRCSVCGQW